ncbi:MAG TPA: uracil-DNA glycosylase [Gemmatimonadales bacterium]|nr:uracil-DNA glycosylase [Gemmatimonadales bacterium]
MPFWIAWSRLLADEWARYLRQQIELGGSEIMLSGAASVQGLDLGGHSERREESGGGKSVRDLEEPSTGAIPRAARDEVPALGRPAPARPSWRKGAPPIPGPGLAIESPPHGLDDQLVGLETLDAVAERIRTTFCCALCPNRTHAVPGEGNPKAKLFLVGEGPGATEDAQGRPFVGQAGNLLNGILEAIEVPRGSVYITNIVKCRPPQNRKPLPDEIAACIPYLHRQLEIVRPKVILCLGSTSAEAMLGVRRSLGELRGKVHTYNGIPLVVTYHPAALLRNPNWKKPTWDDVRIARQLLDH